VRLDNRKYGPSARDREPARLAKGRAAACGVSPAGLRIVIVSSPLLVYDDSIPSGASAEDCGAGGRIGRALFNPSPGAVDDPLGHAFV
jgi:hypothetical protein